jgi:hypothetical protein
LIVLSSSFLIIIILLIYFSGQAGSSISTGSKNNNTYTIPSTTRATAASYVPAHDEPDDASTVPARGSPRTK